MNDVAEQPFLYHIEHHQLIPAVAAVLQHHAGNAGLLVGPHQLPALVDGVSAAHLGSHILARLHGIDGDAQMIRPGSGDDHCINLLHGQHFVIIRRAEGIVALCLFHSLCAGFPPILIQIADRQHVDVFSGKDDLFQQTKAPAALADYADVQFLFHVFPPDVVFTNGRVNCSPLRFHCTPFPAEKATSSRSLLKIMIERPQKTKVLPAFFF